MAAVQRMSTGSSSVQSFASKRRCSDSSEGDEQDSQSMQYAFGGDHSAAAASSEAVAVSSWDARALKEEAQAEAEAEEAQAAPAAERSSCAARDEDDDNSDASTGCPESPRVRWGDFAFSEGEEEEVEAAGSSALPPSAEAPAKAKARWADLADSDDDVTSPKARKPAQNVQQGGGLPSGHGPPPQPVETPAPPLAQQGGSSSSLPPAEANAEKDAQGKGAGKQQRGNGGESAATAQPARGAKRGSGSNAAASATAERRGRKGAAAWAERGGGKWQTGGGKWGGQQWWHTESRGSGGWSGAGWNQAGYYNKPSSQSKRQCQLMIGIEEEDEFCVKSKVIGRHGQNMKSIAEKTGAKLRLRGRGSGFLEGPEQVESSDPLMLCVSAPDAWAYQEAHRLARELLESVHSSYCSFCEQAGWPAPELTIEVHEGPRPGSF